MCIDCVCYNPISCLECTNFARAYVWWMNLILNILGFIMVIAAIVAYFVADVGQYVGNDIIIGTAALSAFIIFLSTLALCGSTKINSDNRCTLKIYVTLLILLILAQGAVVAVAFFKEGHLQEFLQSQWENFGADDREAFMEQVGCGLFAKPRMWCGVEFDAEACFDDCYNTIKDSLEGMILVVIIVGGCVLAYELLLVCMACCVITAEPEQVCMQEVGVVGHTKKTVHVQV